MDGETPRAFLSVQEAAEFLRVSQTTIRRYISSGRLPAYRVGAERLIRIKHEDLVGLLSPIKRPSETR